MCTILFRIGSRWMLCWWTSMGTMLCMESVVLQQWQPACSAWLLILLVCEGTADGGCSFACPRLRDI